MIITLFDYQARRATSKTATPNLRKRTMVSMKHILLRYGITECSYHTIERCLIGPKFQSKGIVTTTQPLTRGKIPLRRVSDLQVVTTHPVTASSTTVATEDGTSSQTHPHSRGSSPNPGPGPNSSPSSSRSSSRAPNCPPSHHTSPPRSPSSGIEIEPDREGTAQVVRPLR